MFGKSTKGQIGMLLIALAVISSSVFVSVEDIYAIGKPKIKKIKISPKNVTMVVGEKRKLKVKFTPKKSKRKVKWSSSNRKVAYIKKGIVTAKKPGTVTVTAKAGKKRAKCKVKVKKKTADKVAAAYACLNKFRTKPGVWQWNSDNVTKRYFNTDATNMLKPLAIDKKLEKTAQKRAKEITILFDHYRPDGTIAFSIYPKGMTAMGENIAYGHSTAKSVTKAWEEEKKPYDFQSHRRSMLNERFTHVGIAVKKHKKELYWVQCFGGKSK